MIQKGQTISMSRGRTAIEHDLRVYTPNNVDSSMTKYNKVLVNKLEGKSLEEYTNEYMKPYIDEYNKKQRRSDRKKSYDYAKKYVEEQNKKQASRQNYTAGQLAYEYVIQFGDRNTMSVKEVVEKPYFLNDVTLMFQEFIEEYEKHYPHMNIVLATIHMDEPNGTPHMHILVQPIGEGYKQGVSHQVSLTKALACDGFERSDKKGDRLSLTRWQDDVKNRIMGRILFNHGFYRVLKDGEKNHLPVEVYKRVMAEQEQILKEARQEADEIRHGIQDEIKNTKEKAKDDATNIVKEAEELAEVIKDNAWYSAKKIKEEAVDNREELKKEIRKLELQREAVINGSYALQTEPAPYNQMSIEELKLYRKKEFLEYMDLIEGKVDENGKRQGGLEKLREQKRYLDTYPEKVLETEAGKKALETEKESIISKVYKFVEEWLYSRLKKKLFDALKKFLFEPICEHVGIIFESKGIKLEEKDKEWLEFNIGRAVDLTVEHSDIGSAIEDDIEQNLPSLSVVEKAVEEEMAKRRGR